MIPIVFDRCLATWYDSSCIAPALDLASAKETSSLLGTMLAFSPAILTHSELLLYPCISPQPYTSKWLENEMRVWRSSWIGSGSKTAEGQECLWQKLLGDNDKIMALHLKWLLWHNHIKMSCCKTGSQLAIRGNQTDSMIDSGIRLTWIWLPDLSFKKLYDLGKII